MPRGLSVNGRFHGGQSGQCEACPLQRHASYRCRDISRGCMFSTTGVLRPAAAALVLAATGLYAVLARADDSFPFGFEMTLDAARQPGSKRLPTLEIGDSGEAVLELWCKGGK